MRLAPALLALLALLPNAQETPGGAPQDAAPGAAATIPAPAGGRAPAGEPAAERSGDGAPASAEPPVPPTRLGVELLGRQPLVVRGRTVSATSFGIGTALVRLTVAERLLGPPVENGQQVTVLAYAGDFRPGEEGLVHLLPVGKGERWQVLQHVHGRDPDFAAKVAVTRETAALVGRSQAERDDGAFRLLLARLAAPDRWSREYALGELRWMARERAALFTGRRRATLLAVAADSPHEEVRRGVEIVTMLLPPAPPP